MKEYRITFYPGAEEAKASEGENLLRVAAAAGLYITASCGGNHTCGKCKVVIEQGEIEGGISERLTREEIERGERLACLSRIKSDLIVRIPLESQMSDKRVLKEAISKRLLIPERLKGFTSGYKLDPIVKKYYLELPEPTLEDNIDDFSRLKRELRQEYSLADCSISLAALKSLPKIIREAEFRVTLTLSETTGATEIVRIESGDKRLDHYAVAIDIGTTSIYAKVINLSTGEAFESASDYNSQMAYGEDVINRIVYAQKRGGLKILQQAVVKTINGVIDTAVAEAGINKEKISYLLAAGNTTMIHLLLGIEPESIRRAPYVPVINFPLPIPAERINLDLPSYVYLYLFPGVSSYVGGDITSGLLTTSIHQSDEIILYIDIGTNGEVVLGNKEWLVATSCSAGPAFEGGTIKHGMRATPGAIEQVEISDDYEPMLITIGHKPAMGICGAGLISLVAELLDTGIIDQKGKFNEINSDRIRTNNGRKEYVLCYKDETAIGEDIVILESDIDDLIRAKGAMYAGIYTLLNSVGLDMADVGKIIVAGNLGFHLEIEKAMVIGLFPEIDVSRFSFIGNGSLLGATFCACSREMFDQAKKIATSITNIELSDNPKFMDEYLAALFLPHTDEKRFPARKLYSSKRGLSKT